MLPYGQYPGEDGWDEATAEFDQFSQTWSQIYCCQVDFEAVEAPRFAWAFDGECLTGPLLQIFRAERPYSPPLEMRRDKFRRADELLHFVTWETV